MRVDIVSKEKAIASSEAVATDLMRQTLGEAEGQLDDIYLKSSMKLFLSDRPTTIPKPFSSER